MITLLLTIRLHEAFFRKAEHAPPADLPERYVHRVLPSDAGLPAHGRQGKHNRLPAKNKPNISMMTRLFTSARFLMLIGFSQPALMFAQSIEPSITQIHRWYASFQYLGLTYHPDGGTTPEVYPLKLDKKAYLVLSVGAAANIDYEINRYCFLRFTTTLYKDCAFVTAGCFHLGPRFQYGWKKNRIDVGIGPILSYREDWHQFEEYTTDDFYGDRVYGKWQYRFFPLALELEYLHRINDRFDFQYSLVPGAPLVITSMFGVRFRLKSKLP
jgi:hypothetical protein